MPVEYFVKKFGDYEYGDNLATISESVGTRTRVSTPANRVGRFTAGGLLDSISMTLEGTILADNPDDPQDIIDKWQAFKAAHKPGQPKKFYVNDDKYIMAEVTSDIRAESSKGLSYRNYSVTLTCYDPPWYADVVTTMTPAHDGSDVDLTVVGDSPTYPVITVVVSTISTGGLLTVEDSYGDSLVFESPAATGTYVIDCGAERVTDPSGALANKLISGNFPQFDFPNAGTISLTLTGGLAVSSVTLDYRGRWS